MHQSSPHRALANVQTYSIRSAHQLCAAHSNRFRTITSKVAVFCAVWDMLQAQILCVSQQEQYLAVSRVSTHREQFHAPHKAYIGCMNIGYFNSSSELCSSSYCSAQDHMYRIIYQADAVYQVFLSLLQKFLLPGQRCPWKNIPNPDLECKRFFLNVSQGAVSAARTKPKSTSAKQPATNNPKTAQAVKKPPLWEHVSRSGSFFWMIRYSAGVQWIPLQWARIWSLMSE